MSWKSGRLAPYVVVVVALVFLLLLMFACCCPVLVIVCVIFAGGCFPLALRCAGNSPDDVLLDTVKVACVQLAKPVVRLSTACTSSLRQCAGYSTMVESKGKRSFCRNNSCTIITTAF
ncbi:unnamed protein product [Ectocarpus sp. 13 AM-2016]